MATGYCDELRRAISSNNLKEVQRILSTGRIDLNELNPTAYSAAGYRSTYLLQACVSASPMIVCALVRAGANVNTSAECCRKICGEMYRCNATALLLAVMKRKVDLVEKLLHRCAADVNATNDEGLAPLHLSVQISRNGSLAKYQIPTKINRVQIAQLLLTAGARVDLRDKMGRTPLHIAAMEKDVKIAQLLLQHHARVDIPNREGITPLHISAIEKDAAIAQLLLQHHARVDIPNRQGITPLHISACALDFEMCEMLVQYTGSGGSTTVNLAANDGTTLLHAAIEAMVALRNADNDTSVVQFLIDKGADLTATKHHLTPLHLAADGGLLNTVKVLVEAGADINAETPNTGLTPLDMAEHGERHDIVAYLTARQKSDTCEREKKKREVPSVEQDDEEEESQKLDTPDLLGAVGGDFEQVSIKDEDNPEE